jgi:hypothetical protein
MRRNERSGKSDFIRDPELGGLTAGRAASFPPHQHHHEHHRIYVERADAYAKGYLNGLREYFEEHGYSPEELKDLFPQSIDPSDLNFLAKGLHKKAPGIGSGDASDISYNDAVSRGIRVKIYRLGLLVALNRSGRKFQASELPGDDASYAIFSLAFRPHFESVIF